jgi:hypothetical protein
MTPAASNGVRNHLSERRQFAVLWRDALRKLLNAAVLGRDLDPIQFAIWMTALAATPPGMYAFSRMIAYASLRAQPASVIEAVVLRDRMFFVFYGMVATALLAALTWEALFPDRTDQEVIGALPVRPRTLAAARLSAALWMALIFAAAINVPTAIFFAFVSVTHPALGFLPTVLVAHMVATMTGSLFVFLVLLVARGVVAVAFGADVADRLAMLLQLAAIVSLIELFIYLPTVLPLLVRRMLEGGDAVRWLPPAWFAGLYTWMVGTGRTVLAAEAARACGFVIGAALLAVPVYLWPAQILATRALETQTRQRPGRLAALMRAAARLAPNVQSRAVAQFVVTSLARNRRHLLVVVSYAAVGVAISAISLVAARLRVGLLAPAPSTSLLSVPLVMMFFVALGLRAAFRTPSDIDANWPFRVSPPTADDAASGTHASLLILVIIPGVAVSALAALVAGWPLRTVAGLVAMDSVAGLALVEALLYGWTLVPFACAHVPSEETMKSRWLLYLIPLNVFAFRGASLQFAALGSAARLSAYLAMVILIAGGIRHVRRRRARRDVVAFDTVIDERLEVLNLSEALQ